MSDFFTIWIQKPFLEQLSTVFVALLFIFAIGAGIFLLVSLFKTKGPKGPVKVKLGPLEYETDGTVKEAPEAEEEELSPSEIKFLDILKKKEEIIDQLKQRIDILERNLADIKEVLNRQEIESKFKEEFYAKIPMSQHVVFSNLKRFMERGIDFSKEVQAFVMPEKIAVCKAFLEDCKIKVFHDRLKEFVINIESVEGSEVDKELALHKIEDKTYEWISEYHALAGTLPIRLPSGIMIKGVPPVFIFEFNKWHEGHVQFTLRKLQQALNYEFYHSWQLKLIMILDAFDSAFDLTVIDAQMTLLSLNGSFEKAIQEKIDQSHL